MKFINQHIETFQLLSKKYHVKEMYAFGSVIDDSRFNEKRDADLLVEFTGVELLDCFDNYMDFVFELEDKLNRKVDLLTIKSLQNPNFIKNVERTRKKIYEQCIENRNNRNIKTNQWLD